MRALAADDAGADMDVADVNRRPGEGSGFRAASNRGGRVVPELEGIMEESEMLDEGVGVVRQQVRLRKATTSLSVRGGAGAGRRGGKPD